jgi:hypothetical protein
VGRFTATDAASYPRGARVVCRTSRGLEVGEVLATLSADASQVPVRRGADGALLRAMTPEDELLLTRIEKNRLRAYDACVQLLEQRVIPAVLMDVEHLLDGQTIYFYFLGEVTAELEAITNELAEAYEAQVQFRQFAEAVTRGCGPGCGTDEAVGCGSHCVDCAVAEACAKRVSD